MGRKPFSVKVRQEALRLMMNGASAWDLVEKFGGLEPMRQDSHYI